MTILFVFGFNRLWNLFSKPLGNHNHVFATFRGEFANEPVNPFYIFSKRNKYDHIHKQILSEQELLQSFNFTRSHQLVRGSDRQIIELGRRIERFYLNIFEKEHVHCIVNWNLAYGFQHIGHLLAKKQGMRTLVMEGGLFNPYTLTIEENGVNAQSEITKWNSGVLQNEKHIESFKLFKRFYSQEKGNIKPPHLPTISVNPSRFSRLKRELKQRFIFDFADPETYHHRWFKRVVKIVLRSVVAEKHFHSKENKIIFSFFLSSVYDPQLELPTKITIDKYINSVIHGFKKFRQNHPNAWLFIKEHPLDESRTIFTSLYKQSGKDHILWTVQKASELLSISNGIITINSTLGVDVLMKGKPLLCLGESCYRHENVTVLCSNSFTVEDVCKGLEKLFTYKPDQEIIDSFLCEAYNKTQIPFWQSIDYIEEIRHGLLLKLETGIKS